jgi:hypothetical protein
MKAWTALATYMTLPLFIANVLVALKKNKLQANVSQLLVSRQDL